MQAKGSLSQLVLDVETTFGSNPASPEGKRLPFNSLELAASQTIIAPATITGRRDAVEPGRGRVSVGGSAVIPMDTNAIGWWLKAMFGAATVTGVGPYTHVFKPGSTMPSLVIEKGFTDIAQYFRYNGCKISSFKMSFGDDGELTASIEIIGATETLSGTAYDATPTTVALDRLSNFQGVLKEGGVVTALVKSGDLEINFGLDADQYVLGSIGRGGIPEGQIEVKGTLKALFTDAALINKGINATESSLELTYTDGANSLAFKVPELQYERTSPAITGPAGVVADLTWSGYYNDSAENASIVATLVNTVASY